MAGGELGRAAGVHCARRAGVGRRNAGRGSSGEQLVKETNEPDSKGKCTPPIVRGVRLTVRAGTVLELCQM